MEFEFLVQERSATTHRRELRRVEKVALALLEQLSGSSSTTALAAIPPIGGTSHAVDAVVHPAAASLGFASQRKDLFAGYPIRLQPDWFYRLPPTGILLEVERGKTLANNMDLLDLWKCHICREADHLFLVVPMKVRRSKSLENVYPRVVTRMKTFLVPGNEVNVRSIAIFGYAG
jgi:hypothetical protein